MIHRYVFCVDRPILYWTESVRVEQKQWVKLLWFYISYTLIFESHYQINHNEQTHSETRSSWNDLSSPSIMMKINEKLMDIDLFVDIESKTDFRSRNTSFGAKSVKSAIPIKCRPQWYVCNHMCDLKNGFLNTYSWYGQTLLGSDQSGKDFKKITVSLSL